MVRTRFAPSPTGFLHIGGVRTALFNWLFARHHGGAFVLRIDDTDVERNLEEALEPILEGLRWLGLDWDEGPGVGGDRGPYYQSQRAERYTAAAATLLERGAAYRDYARPEEIREEREAARDRGEPFVYSRRFAGDSPADRARFANEGREGAVRLRMPREGACRFTDLVRGEVEVEWSTEQDHVIQRADGSSLYHLASAVDDLEMGITHVIRAEEHLSNTPRQIFITEALGGAAPRYAHVPLVAEPGSHHKLSKRKLAKYMKDADFARVMEHGAAIVAAIGATPESEAFNPVAVDFYRQVGYLPEAVLNYLLLLGWSLDGEREEFSREEMVRHFSLERVNRSPASFDPVKLGAFQERYMAELSTDEKLAFCLPYLERAGLVAEGDAAGAERARAVIAAAGDRIRIAGDVLDYRELFVSDDAFPYDGGAFGKRIERPEGARRLLAEFRDRLRASGAEDADAFEELMRGFCEERGIKLGAIIHAVRVAVTGKAVGFGMFEILEILGRESAAARIDRALEHAAEVAAEG